MAPARTRANQVYPTGDVLTSRTRLLETKAAGREQVTIANRVRKALASLWSEQNPKSRAVRLAQERALKLQTISPSPFIMRNPGPSLAVPGSPALRPLRACREILDGAHDDVSVEQFYFRGGIDDIRRADGLGFSIGPVRR
jgi:F0F1-type ATP synthase beta subunit